jgi:arsenite methyltransferase
MAELTDTDIRETVRERYAAVARAISDSGSCGCGSTAETSCCAPDVALSDKSGTQVFGAALYAEAEAAEAPDVAVAASLGCGVPTAVADLHEGETRH